MKEHKYGSNEEVSLDSNGRVQIGKPHGMQDMSTSMNADQYQDQVRSENEAKWKALTKKRK